MVDEEPEVVIDMAPEEAVEADSAADAPGSEEGELELDVEFLNSICDDEEDYCWDFQDEETNLINIMSFSRSS